MKITKEGIPQAVRYLTDTGGNPVLPNPGSPAPTDPVDVALDADAFVPLAAASVVSVVQFKAAQFITTGTREVILDADPTPGNILVMFYSSRSGADGTTGVTGPIGWTEHADNPVHAGTDISLNPACPTFGFWHVVETGEGPSIECQVGGDAGNPCILSVVEIAGVASLIDEPSANQVTSTNPKLTGVVGGNDAIVLVGADVQQDGGLAYTPDSGTTELYDADLGGSEWPHQWVGYRIETSPGSYDVGATGIFSLPWGALGFVFDSTGTSDQQQVAPLTVDGDDATFNESTGFAEIVRLDIGLAQRLTSARLLVGFTSSGSKTVHLWASNDADMAGAVDIVDVVFTATGSFTADEVLFSIGSTTAYRYWEFRGPVTDTRTYTVEMFAFTQSFDLSGYQLLSEKGDPNGYASLDSGGLVPVAQLPFIEDLATAETDDTLVLAPDGAGGVEFRAETGGGGSALTVKDEGSTLDTAVTSIDFVGAGVVATNVSHAVTVTISGSGAGASMPVVVQFKFGGNNISSLVLDSAPVSGHTLLLFVDGFNTADPTAVSSTNTTWTKIVSVASGAKYSLWVGVVSGTGGTTITITHANSFLSAYCLEVEDSLSGTLGTSVSSSSITVAAVTPAAPTAGHLVATCWGSDNTTLPQILAPTVPGTGMFGGIVSVGVCYSQGHPVGAITINNVAGTFVIAEIT